MLSGKPLLDSDAPRYPSYFQSSATQHCVHMSVNSRVSIFPIATILEPVTQPKSPLRLVETRKHYAAEPRGHRYIKLYTRIRQVSLEKTTLPSGWLHGYHVAGLDLGTPFTCVHGDQTWD